jgi:hypothetical protein
LNASATSPFRNIPVYDQDGSGTCFAHAATQLVDYWRFKNGVNRTDRINPLYAAWQTKYRYQKEGDTRGGNGYKVIRNLKKSGYCKADKVNSCLANAKKLGGNISDAELIHYLEVLYESYDEHSEKSPLSLKENAKKVIQAVEKDPWVGGSRCKNLSNKIMESYISLAVTTSNMVLDGAFKDCKPLQSLSNIPDPKVYSFGTYASKKQKIDQSLASNLPVTISMCSSMFDNTKNRPLSASNKPSNYKACKAHEVLITGRKLIGQSCKYLLRNSWGAKWKPANVQCACYRKDGTYESICSNVSLAKEIVGCWYSKEDLLSNTFEVTTL